MIRRNSTTPLRITAVGPLPPPPGGVASSLKSLLDASRCLETVRLQVIPWRQMWRLPLSRPDVLHLHFSQPFKRMLGAIIGRAIGAKVVQTIHSNNYDFENHFHIIANYFVNGTIVLNSDIEKRFRSKAINNCIVMTPILAVQPVESREPIDPPLDLWISQREGKLAVVYCYDRRMIDDYDLYGFGFISNLLSRLNEMSWNVIFLDPYACWRADELFPKNCPNAFLQSANVDFTQLLKRVDVYLRPTATDGDSVAVLEALSLGIPVIASDVVPRPRGAQLYRFRDEDEFLAQLELLDVNAATETPPDLTSADEYVQFISDLTA